MGIIELTVSSCLHLVRSNLDDLEPTGIGSGVIVKYKERFFICTVAHFSEKTNEHIGLVTGVVKNHQTQVYYFGDFSTLTKIEYDEDYMDTEDLEYCLQNPDRSGVKLDIAFREIELLQDIIQEERGFDLKDIGQVVVPKGGKTMLIVDEPYEIDQEQLCSFYGRIRPDFRNGIFNFQEALYWGLPITKVDEFFFEMDLGSPIRDDTRFKGCSGAPIIDTNGRIIGLLTHGHKDINQPFIYGFRFDQLKKWIDITYFKLP